MDGRIENVSVNERLEMCLARPGSSDDISKHLVGPMLYSKHVLINNNTSRIK